MPISEARGAAQQGYEQLGIARQETLYVSDHLLGSAVEIVNQQEADRIEAQRIAAILEVHIETATKLAHRLDLLLQAGVVGQHALSSELIPNSIQSLAIAKGRVTATEIRLGRVLQPGVTPTIMDQSTQNAAVALESAQAINTGHAQEIETHLSGATEKSRSLRESFAQAGTAIIDLVATVTAWEPMNETEKQQIGTAHSAAHTSAQSLGGAVGKLNEIIPTLDA